MPHGFESNASMIAHISINCKGFLIKIQFCAKTGFKPAHYGRNCRRCFKSRMRLWKKSFAMTIDKAKNICYTCLCHEYICAWEVYALSYEDSLRTEFIAVRADVLPDVFLKVLEAKRMRARGDARNSAEACRAAGISRSAYYKYKDSVFAYCDSLNNRIVTMCLILRDDKGVLSSIIAKLYEFSVNILTVNQSIPIDSVATVTVSFRFEGGAVSDSEAIRKELSAIRGVVSVKLISGE